MRPLDILRLSLKNVLRGRTRTLLTVFATAIGVFATLLVLSVGLCARRTVASELETLGISGVSIHPKKVAADNGLRLQPDDAELVTNGVKGVDSALAVMIRYGSYSMKNWQGNAVVIGTGAEPGDALKLELLYGRLLNEDDMRSASDVAVVSADFAKMVYGRENIVGKSLKLTASGTRQLEIVGIIGSQSSGLEAILGQSLPSFFYVPHSTLSAMCGESGTDQILISASDDEAVTAAVNLLEREYRQPNSLKYDSISGMRDQIDDAMLTVSVFIAAIGGISVLVAGIGIMNTMLSAALERRREVGVYMSLGARSRDIILEFVSEAGIISCFGSLIGCVAAYGALALAERYSGFELWIGAEYVVAAVVIASVCGILFGVAPAIHASKIDPIEALREQ